MARIEGSSALRGAVWHGHIVFQVTVRHACVHKVAECFFGGSGQDVSKQNNLLATQNEAASTHAHRRRQCEPVQQLLCSCPQPSFAWPCCPCPLPSPRLADGAERGMQSLRKKQKRRERERRETRPKVQHVTWLNSTVTTGRVTQLAPRLTHARTHAPDEYYCTTASSPLICVCSV